MANAGGGVQNHLISSMLVKCKLVQFSTELLNMNQILKDVSVFLSNFPFRNSKGIIRHDKNVYTMMVSVVFLLIVKKLEIIQMFPTIGS